MNQNTDEIIEDMAKAGFECVCDNRRWDESWDKLGDDSFVKVLWKQVAEKMLLSVKFPAELYKVCRDLNFNAERKK